MPTTVSELLGGQAAPRTIEHGGRRYNCRPFAQQVKSAIERRLEADRRAALLGPDPRAIPPEALGVALDRLADEISRGEYRFGGRRYLAWLATAAGMTAVVEVLFGLGADDAADLLLARGPEVVHVVLATILESLPPDQADRVRRAMRDAEANGSHGDGEPPAGFDPNV